MAGSAVLDQNKEEWNHWSVKKEMYWQFYNLCLEMTVKEEREKKKRRTGNERMFLVSWDSLSQKED